MTSPVGSWFASPILSGIVSVLIFLALREAPLEPGLIALPLIYGIVVLINIFSIVEDDPWAHTQWYIALGVAIGVGLIIAAIVWFFVVPRQRKSITAKLEKLSKPDLMIKEVPKIDTNDNLDQPIDQKQELNHTNEKNPNILNCEDLVTNDIENGHKVLNGVDVAVSEEDEDDKPEVSHLFTFLQILTACFGSFAHGGNDVRYGLIH
ncbi:unnamed protein product [Oppiella nova]|uniref:Phosphate transporter n=1 Tax=Oppiella nova TaxID=334625 RepID=A0A7R9QIE4_9ACAR|nr:unnamed protein product [Oppiella nova]CAG2166604.1 unnamed protein product [Oppiella nova]